MSTYQNPWNERAAGASDQAAVTDAADSPGSSSELPPAFPATQIQSALDRLGWTRADLELTLMALQVLALLLLFWAQYQEAT
jgi:hypothetical protein